MSIRHVNRMNILNARICKKNKIPKKDVVDQQQLGDVRRVCPHHSHSRPHSTRCGYSLLHMAVGEKKWKSICRLCGLEFLPKNKQPRILYTRVPTCPASGCVIALIVWRIGPVVHRLNQTVAVGVSWDRGSTLRRAFTEPPDCLKIDPKNPVRFHHFPF